MLKAIIFDFDGVITDTEPVHMEAWQGVLERLGILFDEDEYKREYIGLNDRDFLDAVGRIHGHHFDDIEKSSLIEDKTAASMSLLERDIPLLPGVTDFVEAASKKYLLAICSGANRCEIEFILRRLKWASRFNPIIASDSAKKGKPDPEGYIRSLEGIVERASDMILSEHVLAIEDSPRGVAAARAAGLRCLAVGSAFSEKELAGADRWVLSLADADLNLF